jgi:hypothetical protein
MGVYRKDQHSELLPMVIAALAAMASMTALMLLDFAPNGSRDNADGMITSAVLSRAGATATPSEKPTDIAAPETITANPPYGLIRATLGAESSKW